MLNQAIEKVKSEMKLYEGSHSIQRIGNFLLEQLSKTPDATEKILDPEKSIIKSLKQMEKEVRETIQKAQGDIGVTITDEEGFEIILKYFGIKGAVTTDHIEQQEKPSVEFKVELDF